MYDRFPQGEIASGKFPWIRQKELLMTVLELNQSLESKIYQTVEITGCLPAEFVLMSNPTQNWT